MSKMLAAVAAIVALVVSDAHGDWPEFRGPTGQGIAAATNLPTDWDATTNIVWKTEIPGQGWSSPVLSKGRIYLTSAVAEEEQENAFSLRAICLDAASGAIRWNTKVFDQDAESPKIHSKNSHASPTPIVSEGRLYVHFGHRGTACLDLAGKVIWRNNEVDYTPVHGNGGSAVLVGDALVFSCDGRREQLVVALDRATGKLIWKTPRPTDAVKRFSFATPLVITAGGRQLIISQGSDAVCAYDPKSGREIWRVRYSGYSVVPRPVFGHGLVFLSTGFDSPEVLAIRPDGSGDVTDTHIAWRLRKGAPHTPSLLLVGDELYMVSDRGVASCVDAKTGKPHWQQRIGGNFSASPVYSEGKIYLLSEKGEGVVIRAGRQFKELARNPLDERTLASYAAIDGALFIRTVSRLFRIEGSK